MRRPSRQGKLPVCIPDIASFLFRRKSAIHHHSFLSARRFVPALILCAFLSITCTVVCDGQDTLASMRAYFTAVRAGASASPPTATLMSGKESLYLDSLRPFLQDTMPRVRAKAYEIAAVVSTGAPGLPTRTKGAAILVSACKDPKVENAGLALELLTHFNKTDFSASALDSFRIYLRTGSPFMDRVLKLAGFLGLADLAEDIRPYARPGSAVPVRWAALLALARLGDAFSTEDIARRVKKFPLSDNLVYDIFPDLIYTRRRELIAITVDVLQHDEKSCLSANPEKEVPIPCGYRIMEMLAPVIAGYPVQLAQGGDIRADDYPEALRRVRRFFSTEKDYKIRTDQY